MQTEINKNRIMFRWDSYPLILSCFIPAKECICQLRNIDNETSKGWKWPLVTDQVSMWNGTDVYIEFSCL